MPCQVGRHQIFKRKECFIRLNFGVKIVYNLNYGKKNKSLNI